MTADSHLPGAAGDHPMTTGEQFGARDRLRAIREDAAAQIDPDAPDLAISHLAARIVELCTLLLDSGLAGQEETEEAEEICDRCKKPHREHRSGYSASRCLFLAATVPPSPSASHPPSAPICARKAGGDCDCTTDCLSVSPSAPNAPGREPVERVERWAVISNAQYPHVTLCLHEEEAKRTAVGLDAGQYTAQFAPHRIEHLVSVREGERIVSAADSQAPAVEKAIEQFKAAMLRLEEASADSQFWRQLAVASDEAPDDVAQSERADDEREAARKALLELFTAPLRRAHTAAGLEQLRQAVKAEHARSRATGNKSFGECGYREGLCSAISEIDRTIAASQAALSRPASGVGETETAVDSWDGIIQCPPDDDGIDITHSGYIATERILPVGTRVRVSLLPDPQPSREANR